MLRASCWMTRAIPATRPRNPPAWVARRMTAATKMSNPVIEATTELVELADIEAAARAIAPVAVRTPLLPADAVTERVGAPVWIKPEMLQRGGAFKFRGAFNFLSHLDVGARQRGVIAPSSGNHAQA